MKKARKNIIANPYIMGLCALFCCLLWGSAIPTIKIGYSLFEVNTSYEKIIFAGIRFFLAAILIFIYIFLTKRKIKLNKNMLKGFLVLGFLQTTFQYLFFYIGLSNTSGTKSSILTASSTLFSVVLAQFFFKEDKLSLKKIIGLIVGFAGVILVNLSGGKIDGSFRLAGEGFVILSSAFGALASIYTKKLTLNIDSFFITGYQFLLGSLFLIGLGFIGGGSSIVITGKGLALLLYLAFVAAAAFLIWTILLKYNDVSKITTYKFTVPLFGVFLSYMILSERLVGLNVIAAMILVSLSIILISK